MYINKYRIFIVVFNIHKKTTKSFQSIDIIVTVVGEIKGPYYQYLRY